MSSYNTVFGNRLISPSQVSSIEITMTGDLVMVWPLETAPNTNLAAQIIDIASSTGAYSLVMPPANQVSNGTAVVVNNYSPFVITVRNTALTALATVAPGAIYFFYVRDNSTAAGIWGSFQYGAQTSAPSAAALAGPGLIAVGTQLGQDIPVTNTGTNYSATVADQATLINWIGSTGTIGLPSPAAVGNGFYFQVRNSGTSTLALIPSGTDLVNGSPTATFQIRDSAFVVTDGVNWYTIGLGVSQSSFFNLLVISLAGLSGTYTLPTAALNQIGYRFTGALAGNITVIVPTTTQEYWVDNETTGFTFSIGVVGQSSPPGLLTGQTGIFYSDGAKIVNAIGNVLSNPVAVAQGGTGATTIPTAQAALNMVSAGDSFLIAMMMG